MSYSMFRSFQGTVSSLLKHVLTPRIGALRCDRGIHHVCGQHSLTSTAVNNHSIFRPLSSILSDFKPSGFLAPVLPLFNQVCGMKIKGRLELRCKGCYYVSRQGRLYVMCRLKPRHKQTQMMKKFKSRQILTFAHQKKVREW